MARVTFPQTIEKAVQSVKLFFDSYHNRLPELTCTYCGNTYKYNGLLDSKALDGEEPAICPNCRRKFVGGPLDGLTLGEAMTYEQD